MDNVTGRTTRTPEAIRRELLLKALSHGLYGSRFNIVLMSRREGRTRAVNYLLQADVKKQADAKKQANSLIQMDFSEIEARAMAHFIRNNTSKKISIHEMYGININGTHRRVSCTKENKQNVPKRLTVKIERTSLGGGGSFNSADCPKCGKTIILSGCELRTMYVICNKCHCVFNLEK